MKKLKFWVVALIILLFLILIYFLAIKKSQETYQSVDCEEVKVFSYGGDIIGCREFKDSIPEDAREWCNQRFEKLKRESPEHQRYQNMNCQLTGMSSYRAPEETLGCSEYCDYLCCQ